MNRHFIIFLPILALCFVLCGCGSIYACLAGFSPKVKFESANQEIPNIEIWSDDGGSKLCGTTPCEIRCKRGIEVKFTAKHPKCADTPFVVKGNYNLICALDLIFWPSAAVDVATGGLFIFKDPVKVSPRVIPHRPPNANTTKEQLLEMAMKEIEYDAYDPIIKAEAMTRLSDSKKKEDLDAMYIKLRTEKKYK